MSYTPSISGSGLVGWQLLQNTLENQRTAFNSSSDVNRDADYFRSKIKDITSPSEFVSDRRLMSVALTSFGLIDQIDSNYLIRRVLEEGTDSDGALANKLGDSRYVALAETFDFTPQPVHKTQEEGFGETIFEAFEGKTREHLELELSKPEYISDPAYATLFREQVEANIEISRDYFFANISMVSSAEDLLNDRDLLQVVLTAFGVEDRQNSQNLLKRVLEEGTEDRNALANVLGDENLIAMAKTFAFDQAPIRATEDTEFSDEILDEFRSQKFENSVIDVDPTIGTALRFQRSLPELAGNDVSDNTKWYHVLGNTMLRNVFETALNLPDAFSQIDLEKQLEVIQDKVQARFGVSSFSDFTDTDVVEKIIQSYLLQDQISQSGGFGSQQIALTLLSQVRSR